MFKLLENEADWQELRESVPILIVFKHSNICPISIAAKERLVSVDYLLPDIYELVVQDNEDLSGLIANELGIKHETPQVLVIQNGESVYDRSYEEIKGDNLVDFVRNLQKESK